MQDDALTGPLEVVVPADLAGQRLDRCLSILLPQYSRARLQHWIADGRVSVDGRLRQSKDKVWTSEHINVHPLADPTETAFRPEAIALQIVHEDDSILVVNKPAGLVVHPGAGNWEGTLLNALLHHAPQVAAVPRAGIVHRLDKETSGLLVVAKTLTAQTDLVRQLQAHTVSRLYWAVVIGRVAQDGAVDAPLGRHPSQRTRMAIVSGGKPALTRYRVVERLGECTWIECSLATGRTHQIRVHMQSIGFPLLGDPVYGRTVAHLPKFTRQALHAHRLAFQHPETTELCDWHSPLPQDMADLLKGLGAKQ